ncbi:alpha/beta hydrolase [Planctomycetales bacterium ZRK34]|nr:alpha/beta hydrolase [Planctomycetales bacterium ZRK34]
MRLVAAMVVLGFLTAAALGIEPTRIVVYKTVGDVELTLHIFEPPGHQATDKTPAMVFFHGGGWVNGAPDRVYQHAAYLSSRGLWVAAPEYRIQSRHHTTPIECVKDGKSAMRYVRAHATEFGIDPDRIAAGGGSAGGHIAAATAVIDDFNEDSDDLSVSPVPNALLLYNPVYDNSKDGYGYGRVKDYWQKISPMEHIRKGMPPTVVFFGTKDQLISVAIAKEFQRRMQAVGSRSELHLYEGLKHGFSNPKHLDGRYFRDVVRKMDEFLISLGYLSGKPAIQ